MACVDAAICFFIPYYAIRTNAVRTMNDVFSVGKTMFTALLGTVTLEVCCLLCVVSLPVKHPNVCGMSSTARTRLMQSNHVTGHVVGCAYALSLAHPAWLCFSDVLQVQLAHAGLSASFHTLGNAHASRKQAAMPACPSGCFSHSSSGVFKWLGLCWLQSRQCVHAGGAGIALLDMALCHLCAALLLACVPLRGAVPPKLHCSMSTKNFATDHGRIPQSLETLTSAC